MSLGAGTLGAAAAFASSCTWAYASARYALAAREVSPPRVNLVRIAISWPVFLAIALAEGSLGHAFGWRAVGWLTLSALCSYAFADAIFFAAAKRLGVSSALAIASTYPLWAALKGSAFDGEPFGLARACGVVCCVGGVVAIIRLGAKSEARATGARWGVPLALLTSVLWAGNTIAIKAGSTGMSLAAANTIRYGVTLLILVPVVYSGRVPPPRAPAAGWRPMVPAVILDCLIGSAFFIYGLDHTDLAVGATLSSLAPLISLPIAVRLGAEKLSPQKLVAVVTTVLGVVLLARS